MKTVMMPWRNFHLEDIKAKLDPEDDDLVIAFKMKDFNPAATNLVARECPMGCKKQDGSPVLGISTHPQGEACSKVDGEPNKLDIGLVCSKCLHVWHELYMRLI